MRGTGWLTPLMLLLALHTPALGANLLVNGDAERGSTWGWSTSSSEVVEALQSASQRTGTVEESEGDWFFSLESRPASSAYLTQAGTSGLQSRRLTLAGMVQTEDLSGDDYGTATLRIYGDPGVVLAQVSTPQLVTLNFTWLPFEVSLDVPSAAQSWEVTLSGTLVYGSHVNVFYDAVSLRETYATRDDAVRGQLWLLPPACELSVSGHGHLSLEVGVAPGLWVTQVDPHLQYGPRVGAFLYPAGNLEGLALYAGRGEIGAELGIWGVWRADPGDGPSGSGHALSFRIGVGTVIVGADGVPAAGLGLGASVGYAF